MIKKILIYLIICLISTFGIFSYVLAANTGNYTSAKIGEDKVSAFISFKVINQSIPSGTSITYQFAGSKDNFNSWSGTLTTNDTIDLSNISQLKSSNYLKVKINLSSDNSSLPSLEGFEVNYDVLGTTTTTTGSSSSSGTPGSSSSSSGSSSTSGQSSSSSSSSTSTSSPSPSSSPTSSTAKTTQTKTVSLSKNQLSNKLVSTGSNLWINLAVALVLTGLTTYLILRRKQAPVAPNPQTPLNPPTAPNPPTPPVEPPIQQDNISQ